MKAKLKTGENDASNGSCLELASALEHLDRLLFAAVRGAEAVYGSELPESRFRGLAISRQGAERYLSQSPFASHFENSREVARAGLVDIHAGGIFAWLAQYFGLSLFDLDALLIALAPDLELRYERLFGFIQDDVTRRRPTVQLILDLLCDSPADKLAKRSKLNPDGPLVRHRLVHLVPDPNHVHPPLLGHYLKPDDQLVSFLLGESSVDARLSGIAEIIEPDLSMDDLVLAEATSRALRSLSERIGGNGSVLAWFYGPSGSGKTTAAGALAKLVGRKHLSVRLPKLESDVAITLIQIALREGLLKKLLVHFSLTTVEGVDDVFSRVLHSATASPFGVVISAEAGPPSGLMSSFIPIHFESIRRDDRRRMWSSALKEFRARAPRETVETLARRFRMRPGHIRRAVHEAFSRESAGDADGAKSGMLFLSAGSLLRAARSQTVHGLSSVASRIEPHASWDDLVLPADTAAQLRELCQRVDHHDQVFDDWAFAQKLTNGRGNTALFAGPSGTGKTMAAEVVANELGLDLYRIDLARIVSKYIGETEKNLDRVFAAAEGANAILFFDEADALFGKRSEVKDSHDRYANIEISYLLQKMEQYEGIAILASNLRQNLDDAFLRRLAFTIHFPFPDEANRRRIWERIWPTATPVAADVDLGFMAREFKLSGGHIKNIALSATFSAAADGGVVTLSHLVHSTRREYEKLGKSVSEPDLRLERQGQR